MSFKKTVSYMFLFNKDLIRRSNRSANFRGIVSYLPDFKRRYLQFPVLLSALFLLLTPGIKAKDIDGKPVLPPVAVCRNISVQLGTNGIVSIAAADVDAGSYDPDGTITNRIVVPNSFTCSQKGSNNVILTVTDNEGLSSSCTATVIVEDRTAPLMACRNITLYLNASGKATLTGADINNGSSDNCGSALSLLLSRTNFDCSDIGTPVSVTLTGTDDSGNSSSCTATVTVNDTISPSVNVKTFDLVLDASGNATLLPSDVDNGSFDNCGPVTLSVTPSAFTCNDLGKRTVVLTAQDSNGNSSSRSVEISVSSTLKIAAIDLSSCDLAPTLALFQAEIEGGDGNYSYLWRGLEPASKPFMVIIPFPPSLQFFNTTVLQSPFFNNTMSDGIYNIRLTVTDGNGCKDSSQIRINKTGITFNNQTMRYSEACEGEIMTYAVNYKSDASYSWSVTNGTILSASQDTSRIQVQWNLGITLGRVVATIKEPNVLFPGSSCESEITDSVTIIPVPSPVFASPSTSVCSGSVATYTLVNNYLYHAWSVTGGVITGGGESPDNFVTVRWGAGPAGTIAVTAGNNVLCEGSIVLNISVFNLTGRITSVTNVKCNGGSDGSVTIAADAGTGVAPYMYSVDGGSWQAGGTITGLSVGNHTAHVRDALLCTFDIPFVIIQPPKVAGMVSSQKDVSCTGGSDGSATVMAAGGTLPYQYSLNGGAYQAQNVFNGLPAGSYTITIRDVNGCTGTVPFTITEPAAVLSGSVNVTNVACNGASTGAINLTVIGGTPPFSFLWNNGRTTEDLVNIPAGNYSVLITDSHNCTATVPATITQPAAILSGSATTTSVLCFGASTGSVNLTVTGGTPAYTYLWSNGATTEDLANVPAGIYSVTITDSNGCTATTSATIAQPASAPGGSITSQTNVSCRGGNDGVFTVTGNGGTPPYQYRLGTGVFQPSGTFSSLTAGIYSITVRDANLCTFTLTVNITEPLQPLSGSITSQTNILCFGNSTGNITAAGSGGTVPYMYSIDGGSFQSSGSFGNLSAGNHTVVVRDKNLCTFNLTATITQPASAVDGSITSQTNVNCFGATTGSVTVTGSGGTPSYTYSIDGGTYQASGIFNNLAAGNHTVSVRDMNSCVKSIPVVITQPAAALSVTLSKTDVACFGGSTGTATVTAAGGTSPYSYSWNTVPVQTNATATGLAAGTYSVTVTDTRGCSVTGSISVTQPPAALSASVSVTDIKCNGGSDGAINLTVTGAKLPVSFLWSNGAVTEDLSGLTPGIYSVQITDAGGCTAGASGTVNQPQVLTGTIMVTDVACFGNSTGSCDLSVTGGISPYTFLWSNGAATEDIGNLASGTYSVTITDKNLCTKVLNATVQQPSAALSGTITSQSNVTVYGGSDGSVTVTGSGGTGPYEYNINSGTYQASGTFNSLTAGSYTVRVRDARLCTFDINVTITQPMIPLTARVDSHIDVLCSGGSTGSVSITGWGGTSPYTYSLNGGPSQPDGNFESLAAGNYAIRITDFISDVFDTLIVISEPPAMNVTVTGVDNKCFGGSEGTATASVSGGVGNYSYVWNTSPVQNTATATGLAAGLYSVSVTDGNGCMVSKSVTIGQPASEMLIPVTVTNVRCAGGSDGTAIAQPSAGTSPYTYEWSTSPVQNTQEATGLSAGIYIVTVTDASGCIKTASAEITEPAGMTVESSVTPASCPESADGSITLTVSGGSEPYSFDWAGGVTTQNREDLGSGDYSVVITDNDLCTRSASFTVGFTGTFSCVVIPDIITPNNDGFNDEWRIKNIELYPDAEINVYNRWGKLVFSTRNISANPWDGTFDGKLVPTDSYHYILRLNDGSKPISGVISVIR